MRYLLQMCIAIVLLASPLFLYAEPIRLEYDAGYRFQRVERIPYNADNPLRAEFDYGRLASLSHFLDMGVTAENMFRAGVLLGKNTMEVHTGEGETFEYSDAPILGLTATFFTDVVNMPDLSVEAGIRYLYSSSDEMKVTYVARDEISLDGHPELNWKETTLYALLAYKLPKGTSAKLGLEYVSMNVDQSWVFDLGRAPIDTTFNPESSVGFLTGVSQAFSERWMAYADINFGHRVAFSGGIRYWF